MKYKIPFTGFAYVEADSPEEALDLAEGGDTFYEETEFENPVEVDEFTIEGGGSV